MYEYLTEKIEEYNDKILIESGKLYRLIGAIQQDPMYFTSYSSLKDEIEVIDKEMKELASDVRHAVAEATYSWGKKPKQGALWLLCVSLNYITERTEKLQSSYDSLRKGRNGYDQRDEYAQKDDSGGEHKHEDTGTRSDTPPGAASIFFKGCTTRAILDTRYKSLAKIYHPDLSGGDSELMQMINDEYSRLKEIIIT